MEQQQQQQEQQEQLKYFSPALVLNIHFHSKKNLLYINFNSIIFTKERLFVAIGLNSED